MENKSTCIKYQMEAVIMLENGTPVEEIAQLYKTSTNEIYHWFETKYIIENSLYLNPENVPRQNELSDFDEIFNDVVKRVYENNENNDLNILNEIQDKSRTESVISNQMKTFRNKVSLHEKVEAVKMFENGISIREIAKKYDNLHSTIHYWIKTKEVLIAKLNKESDSSNDKDKNDKHNKSFRVNSNALKRTNKNLRKSLVKNYCIKTINEQLEENVLTKLTNSVQLLNDYVKTEESKEVLTNVEVSPLNNCSNVPLEEKIVIDLDEIDSEVEEVITVED